MDSLQPLVVIYSLRVTWKLVHLLLKTTTKKNYDYWDIKASNERTVGDRRVEGAGKGKKDEGENWDRERTGDKETERSIRGGKSL